MRIVFMGTPEFAVASLDALHTSTKHNVVAVVTVADKPAGRGKQIRYSPVKDYALVHQIPLLQPEKLKSPEFIAALQSLNADLFVVVAFRMLPEVVWAMPAKGTLNIHASLLPQYRGAAPINHAIINGETESGLTTFMIDKEIDTGKIILQKKVAISRTDNAGDLHDRLMELSRNIIIETCEMLDHNQEQLIGQEELVKEALIHAPKIFKEHTKLNPNMSQKQAYNLIRGLSPYPSAYFELISPENEKMNLKVYATSPAEKMLSAGEIATDGKTFMVIGLSDGTLFIDDLQLQNKKRMQIEDFLRGFRLNNLWKWK